MTADFWNKYYAGQTFYARPVDGINGQVRFVPTHDADGTPLEQDWLENAGEVGISCAVEDIN